MIKIFFKKKIIFLVITFIAILYLLINSINGSQKLLNLKSLINDKQKQLIKKYVFPYKTISQQQNLISKQKQTLNELGYLLPILEFDFKKSGNEIKILENSTQLSNNKTLKKYKLLSGFYQGIHELFPGSGYIEFHQNNKIILSSRGILAYKKNLNDINENFKQIKNNINNFIGLDQFQKNRWFSLKDILIHKDKVLISYTEEIKEDCWNTSIIYGGMNYQNIIFKKLFSTKECIHSFENVDDEFNAHQSGGKLISFDDNHILFSTGDYRNRYLAQNKKNINGKIIKINIENSNYQIISMGHRNPQGLYFDKENSFILETEHGPMGGDEINLIEINKINQNEIQNYGWPISSAGEHYLGKFNKVNKKKYQKYPLYKSHSKYGFIEPLKSFVPSIGISEIVKVEKNKYAVSAMKNKSLYFFEINKQKQIINLEKIEVFERVRDMGIIDNQLILFMENSASIGVIDLN